MMLSESGEQLWEGGGEKAGSCNIGSNGLFCMKDVVLGGGGEIMDSYCIYYQCMLHKNLYSLPTMKWKMGREKFVASDPAEILVPGSG